MTKEDFHKRYARALREIAKGLGLTVGTFDIRSNKAGPGVLGEVTLHGERIYMQVGGSCCGEDRPDLLYRTVRGRTDYTGGVNHWDIKATEIFTDRVRVLEKLRAEIETTRHFSSDDCQ